MNNYIMPKLVSDFSLSNSLIEEAKKKQLPEAKKIKTISKRPSNRNRNKKRVKLEKKL